MLLLSCCSCCSCAIDKVVVDNVVVDGVAIAVGVAGVALAIPFVVDPLALLLLVLV